MRLASVSSALMLLALASAMADAPDNPPAMPVIDPGGALHDFRTHPATHAQAGPRSNAAGPVEANPALAPPNKGRSNTADQVFLTQARLGGVAEVELARMAEQRAGSQSVREFARKMIMDHDQMNRSLQGIAETNGAPPLDQLDAGNRQVRDALSRLSGAEFEIEYLRLQVQAHQRMAQLMQYEIGSGADAQVQRVAMAGLPRIYNHLAIARQLLDQVSMQNPQIAAAPPRKVSGMPTPQTPRASLN
jgi:putative membrane protein